MGQTVTPFSAIYDIFLSYATDDLYMEITREETEAALQEYLLAAVQLFEFPRVDLTNFDTDLEQFNITLSYEEKNILAVYMLQPWFDQQLASCELSRMKYTGADFKMTSQANHMSKLQAVKKSYKEEGFHLQRLYKRRRRDSNGIQRSTFGDIMAMAPEYKVRGYLSEN